MKPAAVAAAALLCTALAACRSAGWHQFQMQAADRDVVDRRPASDAAVS